MQPSRPACHPTNWRAFARTFAASTYRVRARVRVQVIDEEAIEIRGGWQPDTLPSNVPRRV